MLTSKEFTHFDRHFVTELGHSDMVVKYQDIDGGQITRHELDKREISNINYKNSQCTFSRLCPTSGQWRTCPGTGPTGL